MADATQLTPSGIPTMSFDKKADELETLLTERAKTEQEMSDIILEVRKLFYVHGLPAYEKDENAFFNVSPDTMTIYLPVIPEKLEGLVYAAAKLEGRAFSELAQNPSLLKKMEKKFGKKFAEFVRQVDDVFHYKTIEKPKEVDKKATDTVQKGYHDLMIKYKKLDIQLTLTEAKIVNVNKYIQFCKDIVALAPAKPQQQQQKGGNQPQGGQH